MAPSPPRAPRLDPRTLVDPSTMAYIALTGFCVFALVANRFGTVLGLLAALFAAYQYVRVDKVFKTRVPPGWVGEFMSWVRSPDEIYPGGDPDPRPLIKG